VGWRWGFGGAGVLALAVAGAAAVSFGHVDWGPIQGRPHPIQVRLVLLAGGISFFGVAGAQSVATFAVEAGVQEGFRPGSVGYVLAIASILSIGIRVLFGSLADRTGPVRAFIVLGSLLTIGGAGIAVLAAGGPFLLATAGILLGLGVGWSWNGLLSYAVVRANPKAAATASSVIVIGGFTGSAVSPLVFGALVSGPGFATAWLIMAGVMVGAAALSAAAHREAARIHLG
jgi:MFS family permease